MIRMVIWILNYGFIFNYYLLNFFNIHLKSLLKFNLILNIFILVVINHH